MKFNKDNVQPSESPSNQGQTQTSPIQQNSSTLNSFQMHQERHKGIKGHPAYLLPILANKITLPTNQCVFYATTQDPRH